MSRTIKILSIDGGGIRGILPATLLTELEHRIQISTKNDSARLADYFDFFAGTSTGGMLSCLYLAPDDKDTKRAKYSANHAPEFYFSYANNAFNPWEQKKIGESFHKYSPAGLDNQLKLIFKGLKFSQLLKPCLVTSYNLNKLEPCLFLSDKAVKSQAADYLVKDILLATSALPGIFPPAHISSLTGVGASFIDGSIFAHNPAFYAYIQAKKIFPNASNFLVLSLGTGHVSSLSSGLEISSNSDKNWARLLAELSFGDFTDATDVQFAESFGDKSPSNYIRLQPSLEGLNFQPDDVTSSNMEALYDRGQDFIKQNDKLLSQITIRLTDSTGY